MGSTGVGLPVAPVYEEALALSNGASIWAGATPTRVVYVEEYPKARVKTQVTPVRQILNLTPLVVSLKLELTKGKNKSEATITFYDPEGRLADSAVLVERATVRIWGGYANSLWDFGKWTIRSLSKTWPEDGNQALEIKCSTAEIKMAQSEISETYAQRSVSGVVRTIAAKYALDVDIDDTPEAQDVLVRAGISESEWMTQWAAELGYDFWIDGNTLRFKAPNSTKNPELVYWYRPSDRESRQYGILKNVQADEKAFKNMTKVKSGGIDALLGGLVATPDDASSKALASDPDTAAQMKYLRDQGVEPEMVGTLGDDAEYRQVLGDVSLNGQAGRNQAIAGRELEKQKRSFKMTATVVGDPRVKPGMAVVFNGIGTKHSGLYAVVTARHSWDDSGYTTEIETGGAVKGVGRTK